MNGIQNLSKRIRKRIQNSVKRLFNNKSPETDEEAAQKSDGLIIPCGNSSQKRRSYTSLLSKKSGDQYTHGKRQISERIVRSKLSKENEDSTSPLKTGEGLSIAISSSQISSVKSEELNHRNVTHTATKRSQSRHHQRSFVCPTGRHADLKYDELCVCLHVEQLSHNQTQPIVYEWHKFKSEPTCLDSLKLEHPTTCIQGGQGVVFWVCDNKNNRHFALKMKLRDTRSRSSWMIEQRESKVLREIQHNFIVNLFHVHETSEAMFMTMEYLDGGCLWSHIAKKGTLPESYTVYYSACITDALKYLHRINIVYRDLKAENIVLDVLGRPKLIDFGMAKRIGRSSKFSSCIDSEEEREKYPATQYYFAAYLAPEIYTKPSSANIFIDSWGIGYVVSELLLGYGVFVAMPWENGDKNKINENWTFNFDSGHIISSHCRDFLEKMLMLNPASRMSIENSISHPFFQQVQWPSLMYIKPPNLSVFGNRIKGSKIIRATVSSENELSSLFEFCDLQLPDPLLTPKSYNQCNLNAYGVTTPKYTPINPNAPSIRLPIFVRKDDKNSLKYKNMSNNLKYDIYRALCINNTQVRKTSIDTISNLLPIRKF